MSAVSHAGGVRHGAEPDPHIVELSKLMLARAPELGRELADRLFLEIDAYRDGTVVAKDEVAASCAANIGPRQSEPAWLPGAKRSQWIPVFTRCLRHLDHLSDAFVMAHRCIGGEGIRIRIVVLIV